MPFGHFQACSTGFFFFLFRFQVSKPVPIFTGPFLPALGPRSLLVRLFPVHNRPLFLLFAPSRAARLSLLSFLSINILFSPLKPRRFVSVHLRDLILPPSTSISPRSLLHPPIAGSLDLPILHRFEHQDHPTFSRHRWDLVVCAGHFPAPLRTSSSIVKRVYRPSRIAWKAPSPIRRPDMRRGSWPFG